jgi:hypothetical protein
VIGLGQPIVHSQVHNSRSPKPTTPRDSSAPVASLTIDEEGPARDLLKRQRKTSLKNVLRQSAEIAGEKWSSVLGDRGNVAGNRHSVGPGTVEHSRPTLLGGVSRRSSKSKTRTRTSTAPALSSAPLPLICIPSPDASMTARSSWLGSSESLRGEVDEDIEKRVLEMAGLGLGLLNSTTSLVSGRRVKSEGVRRCKESQGDTVTIGGDIERSRSADERKEHLPLPSLPSGEVPDMEMLRRIANLPSNSQCADCGKSMKASRWATLSKSPGLSTIFSQLKCVLVSGLRQVPMMIFICIRCCGIHRSLGTHISKPRSVDLDIWSPESIQLAGEWGNEKVNGIWEREKPSGLIVKDEYACFNRLMV